MGIHESTRAGSAATGSAAKRPRQQQLGTADASRIISADKGVKNDEGGVVTMKDDTGAKYWGSEEKRAARWAEISMKAESEKVVYPDVEDGLDYAPPLKTLPPQWRVFGRPTIALPDKEQQHEHQRHHQDVADHAGPLRAARSATGHGGGNSSVGRDVCRISTVTARTTPSVTSVLVNTLSPLVSGRGPGKGGIAKVPLLAPCG